MKDKRKYQRNYLTFYLDVFDQKDGSLLGQVYDLTLEGMMLIGDGALSQNSDYSLRIDLKDKVDGKENMVVQAETVRCEKDEEFGKFRTGFRFTEIDRKDQNIVDHIIRQFGYQLE